MGLRDLFFGKQQSAQQALDQQLTPQQRQMLQLQQQTQKQGIESINQAYANPELQAKSQVQAGLRGLGQERQDAARGIGQMLAQRGLGQSSIGLSAMTGLNQGIARRGQEMRASIGDRIRMLQQQRGQALMGAAGGINLGPIAQIDSSPGIAGMIGTLAGGAGGFMLGGPMGAAAGSQMGAGLGQGLSSQFRR